MNDVEEQLDELMDKMREEGSKQFILRRIKHIGFSKTILYICVTAKREEFIYAKDLAEFRKITRQGATYILNDLVNVGMLHKKQQVENMAEYWIKRNGEGRPLMQEYFGRACKTLGIKNKVVIEQ